MIYYIGTKKVKMKRKDLNQPVVKTYRSNRCLLAGKIESETE